MASKEVGDLALLSIEIGQQAEAADQAEMNEGARVRDDDHDPSSRANSPSS